MLIPIYTKFHWIWTPASETVWTRSLGKAIPGKLTLPSILAITDLQQRSTFDKIAEAPCDRPIFEAASRKVDAKPEKLSKYPHLYR